MAFVGSEADLYNDAVDTWPFADGDIFEAGNHKLRVRHTRGHDWVV